jgi:outer membrane protein assembly factor BamB
MMALFFSRPLRQTSRNVFACAAAAILLSGCGLFGASSKPPPLPGERIPVMQLEPTLKAAPELADEPVVLPEPAVNSDWPQPFGSATHYIGHVELGDAPKRVWSASIGGGSNSSRKLLGQPIIVDGRIYTMDARARVSAHDAESGSSIWSTDIRPDGESDGMLGAGLAYDDGVLFASSGFAEVVALDAKTGKEIWRRKISGPVRGAPAVGNGRIFVVSLDNVTHALSAKDGSVLWTHTGTTEAAGLLGGTSPALSEDTLVVAYSSGELFGLRASTGRQLWADFLSLPRRTSAVSDLNDIRASPVISGGRVYAIGNAGRMVSIAINSGIRVWDQRISGVQTPWVAGDVVYAVTTDNDLVCLTARDGRVRWVRALPKWEDEDRKRDPISWAGPVLAGDRLILAGSNEVALSVSPYTGDLLGSIELPDAVLIPPVVANRTLYFLTDDGDLIAYR